MRLPTRCNVLAVTDIDSPRVETAEAQKRTHGEGEGMPKSKKDKKGLGGLGDTLGKVTEQVGDVA